MGRELPRERDIAFTLGMRSVSGDVLVDPDSMIRLFDEMTERPRHEGASGFSGGPPQPLRALEQVRIQAHRHFLH